MAELNELVSVIIPVYNAENCIGDTIASIRSQDYTNWEIILVDDNSTDKSLSIIKSLECDNIRVFESTGKSAARARNLGIKEAILWLPCVFMLRFIPNPAMSGRRAMRICLLLMP